MLPKIISLPRETYNRRDDSGEEAGVAHDWLVEQAIRHENGHDDSGKRLEALFLFIAFHSPTFYR